jgi:hypothetical protein
VHTECVCDLSASCANVLYSRYRVVCCERGLECEVVYSSAVERYLQWPSIRACELDIHVLEVVRHTVQELGKY